MGLERFSASWRESYVERALTERDEETRACVFCTLGAQEVDESTGVLKKTAHSFVVLNAFPYGSGHLLIVPLRHVERLDELRDEEYFDHAGLVRATTTALLATYEPEGLNVGFNLGSASGAGIPRHLHTHALPRWVGDTNFMTTIGETRVLPESLASTWRKVHAHL